jgi:hypothetical protein
VWYLLWLPKKLASRQIYQQKEGKDMENRQKQITTPEEAVNALALAAHTAWQTFCIDEPPLPTLLCHMMWSAEEIALRNNCPESVMDAYRRAVFSEHPIDTPILTAQELRDTQGSPAGISPADPARRTGGQDL